MCRLIWKFCNSVFEKIFRRIEPIKYARYIGVSVADSSVLLGHINWGSEPWLISIGERTVITSEVLFSTHDGAVNAAAKYNSKYKDVIKFGRIDIGKECFIGTRTIILPDVIIGDNCIVGAGSLVTCDIPSGEVWGGCPAKRICSIEEYAEKCLKETPDYDVNNLDINKRQESIIIADKRRVIRREKHNSVGLR